VSVSVQHNAGTSLILIMNMSPNRRDEGGWTNITSFCRRSEQVTALYCDQGLRSHDQDSPPCIKRVFFTSHTEIFTRCTPQIFLCLFSHFHSYLSLFLINLSANLEFEPVETRSNLSIRNFLSCNNFLSTFRDKRYLGLWGLELMGWSHSCLTQETLESWFPVLQMHRIVRSVRG